MAVGNNYFTGDTFVGFNGTPGDSIANKALAAMLGFSTTGTVTDQNGHNAIGNGIQDAEVERIGKIPNRPTAGGGPAPPIKSDDLITVEISTAHDASSASHPDIIPSLLRTPAEWLKFKPWAVIFAASRGIVMTDPGGTVRPAENKDFESPSASFYRENWSAFFSGYLREEYLKRAAIAIANKQETNESTAAKARNNCVGGMSEACQGIVRTNQAMCLNDQQMKPSFACAAANGRVLCDKNFFIGATKQLEDLESQIADLKCKERWLQILYAELYRALQMCLANYKRAQLKCQTDKTESCKPKPSAEACAGLKRKSTTKVTVTKKGKTLSAEKNPDSLGYFSLFAGR